jgi:hypothetical protein
MGAYRQVDDLPSGGFIPSIHIAGANRYVSYARSVRATSRAAVVSRHGRRGATRGQLPEALVKLPSVRTTDGENSTHERFGA